MSSLFLLFILICLQAICEIWIYALTHIHIHGSTKSCGIVGETENMVPILGILMTFFEGQINEINGLG